MERGGGGILIKEILVKAKGVYIDARAIIKVFGHQYWWSAGGYDLEIGLLEVDSTLVRWWIVAFWHIDTIPASCTEYNILLFRQFEPLTHYSCFRVPITVR